LANFPTARVMYLSATGSQVEKQFFAALNRESSNVSDE
jgi:hypothetical protein